MKVLLSWSSGKDAAYALHRLRQDPRLEVAGLLSTINEAAQRVSMHAVRRSLLEMQAQAVGVPLFVAALPFPCSNDAYGAAMTSALASARSLGVEAVAFGDLFLEDVRAYREQRMQATGMAALFPLWGEPTRRLAAEMLEAGTRAVLTCVDPRVLDPAFAGRAFDRRLLAELPEGVDPCGERGEFHTFAWDGPAFRRPLPIVVGETVTRDGFVFSDVVAADSQAL